MLRHVSQSGQTLGNISEKHRETSNVSEFARKHFCFSGSKFCFRKNVSTGGQTGKHLRKHRESQMFPQQCFLVCPGLNFLLCFECKCNGALFLPAIFWSATTNFHLFYIDILRGHFLRTEQQHIVLIYIMFEVIIGSRSVNHFHEPYASFTVRTDRTDLTTPLSDYLNWMPFCVFR